MSRLRVLTPTVVDYSAVPGASVRDPDRYARFWSGQQPRVSRLLATAPDELPGPVVVLEHTRPASAVNRYRVIDEHAVDVPVHVLRCELRPEHLPESFAGAHACLAGHVREISLRLYDHGVLLVEILLDLEHWMAERAGTPADRLDALQSTAVALGVAVAAESVRRWIDPVLDLLRGADRDGTVLSRATPAGSAAGAGFGEVLWVTRSLVLDPAAPSTAPMVRHWLKDVGTAEEDDSDPVEELLSGERGHLSRWLNYAFLDGSPTAGAMAAGERFHDAWEAMRYAQVFYAALDLVDNRLSKVLADSAASTARWELERLRGHLVELSQRAELVIIERQDLSKYLKRSVRAEMDDILTFWDYEALVEAPVRFKIDICDRRLAELAAKRTARSALFTDLILLGIGVTSVLGTALALTEFGRTMASDPGFARFDIGRDSVTSWFASQPADAILITSGAISAMLVLVYLVFRRNHGR